MVTMAGHNAMSQCHVTMLSHNAEGSGVRGSEALGGLGGQGYLMWGMTSERSYKNDLCA